QRERGEVRPGIDFEPGQRVTADTVSGSQPVCEAWAFGFGDPQSSGQVTAHVDQKRVVAGSSDRERQRGADDSGTAAAFDRPAGDQHRGLLPRTSKTSGEEVHGTYGR